jgi:hypothetical protein
MSRAPRQPKKVDRFEAVLREGHKLARQFDVGLKDLANYFQENLPNATRHLLVAVPQQMDAWRQEAVEKYGYDPERREWTPNCEESVKSAEDAQGLVTLLNHYYTYRLVLKQWEWSVQSGLSGERLQMAVARPMPEDAPVTSATRPARGVSPTPVRPALSRSASLISCSFSSRPLPFSYPEVGASREGAPPDTLSTTTGDGWGRDTRRSRER